MLRHRRLSFADVDAALELYDILTVGPKGQNPEAFAAVISHPGTSVFGGLLADQLVSMMTLHLLPNVTWGGRPYGLIENVVTHSDHRRKGFGSAVMAKALVSAWEAGAYKVMILSGSKRHGTPFYLACGFNAEDKTGLVIRP